MQRLLIAANRLPVTITKRKDKFTFTPSVGGLATALSSFKETHENLWLGSCDIASERLTGDDVKKIRKTLKAKYGSFPVFLSKNTIEKHYQGFCNKTLWPLFHYFVQYTEFNKDTWETYRHVNRKFCDAIADVAKKGDVIWVHDYHLMLLPQMLREKVPGARIGFFLHTPFPAFDVFRMLPWRKDIIEGLLGADLIGFHQYDYANHFLDCVQFLTGYEQKMGLVTMNDRVVKVDAFPIGIDYVKFSEDVKKPFALKQIENLKRQIGDRKVIFSLDRLDYSKGILKRLEAFDSFLDKYPEYRKKVSLFLVAAPSRSKIEQYKQLKKSLDEAVGRVNGKHGEIGWTPVVYMHQKIPYKTLVALYGLSDIALITPLRDGMNLIAKEFIAAKADGKGVLILSEMAGAAKEMGEALIINPNDTGEIVEAIREALEMDEDEQVERNTFMQERIRRYDVMKWAGDFLENIRRTKDIQQEMYSRKLRGELRKKLISDYSRSGRRLILLDYDGTLVPIRSMPHRARPDDEVLRLMHRLSGAPGNKVVLISGRDRKTLDEWLGGLDIDMIAGHGAWFKVNGQNWKTIDHMDTSWMEQIRPVLEQYVDRTPGSFIEEKDFSLVWHYRKANPQLASIRVAELKDDLTRLLANLDVGILEGNKVVEVKNESINKGRAVMRWVKGKRWDFILALGDDRTDEDVFRALPKKANTIKVGIGPSESKFILEGSTEVRKLIRDMNSSLRKRRPKKS
jgi:trehalose 6-phosphate synthase/phosphatase